MPNGDTVIFGFQCDGWDGTWDYTENAGTPTAPIDHWVNSSAALQRANVGAVHLASRPSQLFAR